MDLEDELQRLFKDERLNLRAAPDADKAVVAGARRVRRNRIALVSAAGVLSAAVLAGGAIVLASPGGTQSNQVANQPSPESTLSITTPSPTTEKPSPATTPPTSTTTKLSDPPSTSMAPSPPRSVPAGSAPLGPTGYGRFRLGMSEEEMFATGQVQGSRVPVPTTGCEQYRIKNMNDRSIMWLTARRGLVAIMLSDLVTTPEGANIGWTEAQLRASYRDLTPLGEFQTAKVPSNSSAKYYFRMDSGKVSEIGLVAMPQEGCVF